MSNNRLFFALLVLLIWLPLASNRAWAILIIGINTLALVWLYSLLRGRASLTPVFVKAKPIFIIWGLQRLENTTLSHESRDEVSLYTLQYWQDYPFFGSGLGSYYTTFPAYQGEDIRLYYEHAHNDYLHDSDCC
ncbi:hypothetical protein PN36_11540 [Candidatus Thiomargarita nelsonii]|uniref:O-antigen ligase-related domain-containing protein n=1 Tax=Candidatus Thiomargarita nelsonii TaxID=1003181 RepID=A0A0A6P6K2_9GAMM|nr:hypothetical protein PN36_11540 [Candidatus Thiomargarita nelsonii]